MKKIYLSILLTLFMSITFGQIGVGRTVSRGSLDLNNIENTNELTNTNLNKSNKGLVLPVNSSVNNIKTPNPNEPLVGGTVIYDKEKQCIRFFDGIKWSNCLRYDDCTKPLDTRSSTFTTPTSPLLPKTSINIQENKISNDTKVVGVNGQSAVGLGIYAPRGVLDSNRENGKNIYGLVLPSNLGPDLDPLFRTPSGSLAVEGTLVYDTSYPCVRFKHKEGWSECLSRVEECTPSGPEPPEPWSKTVSIGVLKFDYVLLNTKNAVSNVTASSHSGARRHITGLDLPPLKGDEIRDRNNKNIFYGQNNSGVGNDYGPVIIDGVEKEWVVNSFVANGIDLDDVTPYSGLDVSEGKKNSVDLPYLLSKHDVLSYSAQGNTNTAASQKIIDVFYDFIYKHGKLGIMTLRAGGGGHSSTSINYYLMKKFGYKTEGVLSGNEFPSPTGHGSNYVMKATQSDINRYGAFGNLANAGVLSANGNGAIGSNAIFVPIENLPKDSVEIIATHVIMHNGKLQEGAAVWLGGPGKRILFFNTNEYTMLGGGYKFWGPSGAVSNYNRIQKIFIQNALSYLLSRRGLGDDAPLVFDRDKVEKTLVPR